MRPGHTLPGMHWLRAVLRHMVLGLFALLLLFEEWGWEPLAALFAKLARLPLWAWIERRIAALPPWAALVTFALPGLGLFPVKVVALFLIARGQGLAGAAVLLAAKLLGTALLARLFALTQPALMRLAWFARWYPRWKAWKDGVMAQVRSSALWRSAGRWKLRARAAWAALRHRYGGVTRK